MSQGKTISYIPTKQLEEDIETLTTALRTSKAGLSELAVKFVTERLLEGKARVENGKIVLIDEEQPKQAA